jgi:hypothetical protein
MMTQMYRSSSTCLENKLNLDKLTMTCTFVSSWWEQVKFRQVDDDLYICVIQMYRSSSTCLNLTCSHHDDTNVQVIINLSKFNLFSPWWKLNLDKLMMTCTSVSSWWEQVKFRQVDDDLYICVIMVRTS